MLYFPRVEKPIHPRCKADKNDKDSSGSEIFAINFAALAREIAMDIFELPDILELHRLRRRVDEDFQANRQFQEMWRS